MIIPLAWRPSPRHVRRFEQREAPQPLGMMRGEGERDGAAARVADEMERVEPGGVHDPLQTVHLEPNRVASGGSSVA